jgi:hypothetical protein
MTQSLFVVSPSTAPRTGLSNARPAAAEGLSGINLFR